MSDQSHIALPPGYRLENYRLDSVLGHGGFGITYQAVDEDLQQVVAIKEYVPREVAFRGQDSTVIPLSESDRETFEWGLERFLDEARTLARFQHPNIVGVRRFMRANETAYLVMDYCAGESLESVLARDGTLAPERVGATLVPLLNALEALHTVGVTHRDIKPGNIYLRDDGSPVLLDFGAARQALAQHSRSVTAMATPGYAAFEQYSAKGKQGPWTDVYGLGATLYRCVTGQRPPDASDRMLEDELVPAVEMASGRYPKPLLQQIDAALRLRPEERPQNVAQWRRLGLKASPAQVNKDGDGATETAKSKPQMRPDITRTTRGRDTWGTNITRPTWGRFIAAIILLVIFGFSIHASNKPPGSIQNEGQYRILGSQGDVVLDTVTGLEWQRCSLGQTWDGRTCVGEAGIYTWNEAHHVAGQMNNWRLPTIDELRTLTYCSSGQPARFSNGQMCQGDHRRPTIVAEAFPNTPTSYFWSASPVAGHSGRVWHIDFNDGGGNWNLRSLNRRVRLVRGGQ